MHHLISGINSLIHFVSHVLICLFLTHHTSMIISPRQRHHHHSCHPSPHHSFIRISKLFFFSNLILHRHLAVWHPLGLTPRLFRPAHGFYFYYFQFFWVLIFIIILYFLPFQFFSLILLFFTSVIFRIFLFLHLTVFLFSLSLISFFF